MTGNGMLEGFGIMYNSSPIGAPEIGKHYTEKYTNSLSGQFSIATVDEWITKEDQYGIFNPKSKDIVFGLSFHTSGASVIFVSDT